MMQKSKLFAKHLAYAGSISGSSRASYLLRPFRFRIVKNSCASRNRFLKEDAIVAYIVKIVYLLLCHDEGESSCKYNAGSFDYRLKTKFFGISCPTADSNSKDDEDDKGSISSIKTLSALLQINFQLYYESNRLTCTPKYRMLYFWLYSLSSCTTYTFTLLYITLHVTCFTNIITKRYEAVRARDNSLACVCTLFTLYVPFRSRVTSSINSRCSCDIGEVKRTITRSHIIISFTPESSASRARTRDAGGSLAPGDR